jgi:hypothetical protein
VCSSLGGRELKAPSLPGSVSLHALRQRHSRWRGHRVFCTSIVDVSVAPCCRSPTKAVPTLTRWRGLPSCSVRSPPCTHCRPREARIPVLASAHRSAAAALPAVTLVHAGAGWQNHRHHQGTRSTFATAPAPTLLALLRCRACGWTSADSAAHHVIQMVGAAAAVVGGIKRARIAR